MARNWLLAHWKRLAMQGVLCALLLVTIALAALVAHEKRLALRLPLAAESRVGYLDVSLPKGWTLPAGQPRLNAGDFAQADEVVPEPLTGRRLTIQRLPARELIPPLDFLLRGSFLLASDLTGKDPSSPDRLADPARVQALDVARWPGVMVSRTILHFNGRRAEKQILACSVMARGQAVVIKLEGPGAADAADEELVRQMAESTAVYDPKDPTQILAPEQPGSLVELGDGVFAAIPDRFTALPADDRTSRDLLGDGSDGHWTAIELVPCLWLADDPPAEQLLTMLAARDRTWHSASVTQLGETVWRAEREPLAGEQNFPARAYCITNGTDQAMLAILRGGWRDDGGFDRAWAGVSRNVRFTRRLDLPALLARGKDEAAELSSIGLAKIFPSTPIDQNWFLWNPSENSDRRDWMTLHIAPSSDGALWDGTRTPSPAVWQPTKPSASGEGTQQSWGGSADLSTYWVHTDQVISSRGETNSRRTTQRLEFNGGVMHNPLAADTPRPVPPQFVPGGWLPMLLSRVGDSPMILRCESFMACDGAAPPGLLTLYVARSRADGPNCVSVTVNGSGRLTKFWYEPAGLLRQIDLGGGVRAQGVDAPQLIQP